VPALAPVRGTPPPPEPPPPRRGPSLPRVSLPWIGLLAALMLSGLGLLGWSLFPHQSGGHLRAPVARALDGACVEQPALCPGR
jgi:hypothetical protein